MRSKILNYIVLLVFFLVDIINFNLNYREESFDTLRSEFWLFHMGISIIYILINTTILKNDLGYYDLLIFFLPAVGFFMVFIEEIFSIFKGSIKNSIEEAYDIEKYVKDDGEEELELQKELNTIAAYDSLTVKTPDEKKKFIFEFNPPNVDFKVEILERALKDRDINVIHYAAVELNRLDVEFQKNIKEQEKKGDKLGLYKAYMEYINSGILKDFMVEVYLEKSLDLLLNLVEGDKTLREELLILYKKADKKVEYEKLLGELIGENPEKRLVEELLKFLYSENRFEEMLEHHRNYKTLDIALPYGFDDGEVK
jgi:hypothetical protein